MDHRDRRCRVRRSYRDLQIEFDPVRPSHADCWTIAVVTAKKEQGAKPCSLHFKVLILAFITLGARWQRIPRRRLGSSQDLDRSLGFGLQRRTLQFRGDITVPNRSLVVI